MTNHHATWIFYAVLNKPCAQVAVALNQPLDRISTERVFRGLDHHAQAVLRGTQQTVVAFLVEHHRLFAGLKRFASVSANAIACAGHLGDISAFN